MLSSFSTPRYHTMYWSKPYSVDHNRRYGGRRQCRFHFLILLAPVSDWKDCAIADLQPVHVAALTTCGLGGPMVGGITDLGPYYYDGKFDMLRIVVCTILNSKGCARGVSRLFSKMWFLTYADQSPGCRCRSHQGPSLRVTRTLEVSLQ